MTFGEQIIAVMRAVGFPPMPWQTQVALVGGELDPETGLPAYREITVTVPRQSGKTTIVLGWEIQRARGWGAEPQRIAYSAQTGNDARKKLVEDQKPILDRHRKKLGVTSIKTGMGNEAVEFVNGSRIVLLASSEEAGHGKTIDLGVKDELFADEDHRRDQALIPAMATRAAGQVLTTSTAGTEKSVALNAAIARGRQAVDSGKRSGTAYFEWSADPDDDPDDPEVWWRCMPALGFTITEPVVEQARSMMSDGEFRRAFLNIAMVSNERIIPRPTWDLVNGPSVAPDGVPVFGVDINPDRTSAAIVAASAGQVEVIDHRAGTGWVLERVLELHGRWGATWAVDGSGNAPVASIVPQMVAAGVPVEPVSQLAAASAELYDAIVDRRVLFRRHQGMDDAVDGVAWKVTGDGRQWARKGETDISPLMAATVAHWVDREQRAAAPTIW